MFIHAASSSAVSVDGGRVFRSLRVEEKAQIGRQSGELYKVAR